MSDSFPELFCGTMLVSLLLCLSLLVLQSHPPVTGVLKWEILESALGSAPEGAPGNRGALGGATESAQGDWGVLQGVFPRVLNAGR